MMRKRPNAGFDAADRAHPLFTLHLRVGLWVPNRVEEKLPFGSNAYSGLLAEDRSAAAHAPMVMSALPPKADMCSARGHVC